MSKLNNPLVATNGPDIPAPFLSLLAEIPQIGISRHSKDLLENAMRNLPLVRNSFRNIDPPSGEKSRTAIVISAGPSLVKNNSIGRIKQAGYEGTIISVDGALAACLREGLVPDYVMTLDPHPTRIVRWFGDPDFETHSANDDYFTRQDLDIEFRKNSISQNRLNIEIINKYAPSIKVLAATCAPRNVAARLKNAGFDIFWFNPLVDNPLDTDGLTRKLYDICKIPCLNTGGTVGTAAWIFACSILKIRKVGLVGVDFGYYQDTPIQQTQTYYELMERCADEENIKSYFVDFIFPLTGQKFFTDPTYYWYRNNFLELHNQITNTKTFNCTEGGTLISEHIPCVTLDQFLSNVDG